MAEQNILKITCPLRLIDFRALNFYIFLVLVLCTFMICQNYTLALTFFFFTSTYIFTIYPLILVVVFRIW